MTGFEKDGQRIQARIANALEAIARALQKGSRAITIKVVMPDGKVLAETVVKAMPRVLADRHKVAPPQRSDLRRERTAVEKLEVKYPELLKACKRRVKMGSVWHRKAGKAGVMIVEVVGRGVTHAILKHRGTGRESRTRYDYFDVNVPGCKGQWRKGEPS
jgi:hypothetical protein